MARDLPTYLNLTEAADVMSVSVKTIRRQIADGTIPAYQCGKKSIRIRLEDLEAALKRIPSATWATSPPLIRATNSTPHRSRR